jgi:hypothetical protein
MVLNTGNQQHAHVFVLEQLGCSKEKGRSLVCPKGLSNIKQIHNACKEGPAFSWANGRLVEDSSFLSNSGLVVIVGAQAAVIISLRVCHPE